MSERVEISKPTETPASPAQRVKEALLPSGPKQVAEPEKELRFTRMQQAKLFLILTAISVGAAITFFATAYAPLSPKYIWIPGIFLLVIAFILFRLSLRCARHAYILLSPLGIEIFPFFKARENLQVIFWSEVKGVEIDEIHSFLTLHFNDEKTSGVKASLKPIAKEQRDLLKRAIEGLASRNQQLSTNNTTP